MSMLAEPRRKQKWSVDPRNSNWSNDESKFGHKMLERMGWSKGKGLGKTEQGATEHIKVKVKNNSLGLGTAVNHEDNWIAHQDDFNQLLAELNNCHGQNNTEEQTQDQAQHFSLEEKSKTSKKRVHYMKFTKGKDLSSRSKTDLACIFGKRAKQSRDHDEASSDSEYQEKNEVKSNDVKNPSDPEVELNTVTSTLTMQEYFAQRMAQLKKSKGGNQSITNLQDTCTSSSRQPPVTPESTENTPNTSDTEESQTKKKRKKQRKRVQEESDKLEESEDALVIDETAEKKKKKKKKNKQNIQEEDVVEERAALTLQTDTAEDTLVPSAEKKKKKKKKKKKDRETPTDTTSINQQDLEGKVMNTDILVKKRKREEVVEQSEGVIQEKPKKDKKKKKNKN